MNRLYIISALILLPIITLAQKGMQFREIKLDEAIKQAQKEDKLIFIDCYTEWCGPCKVMAKSTFPDEEVGNYMNPRFINLKYDVYKGKGKEIMEKFQPKCFPTYLILDKNGKEIHRFSGQAVPKDFILKVKEAFDPSKRLSTYQDKYAKGEYNSEFLLDYIEMLLHSGEYRYARKIFGEYHKKADIKITPKSWKYYNNKFLNHISTDAFKYMVYNRKEAEKTISPEELEKCVYDLYRYQLTTYLNGYHLANEGYDEQLFINYKKDINSFKFSKPNDLLILANLAQKIEELPLDEYLEKLPQLTKGLDGMNKYYSVSMFTKFKYPLSKKQKAKILEYAKQFREEAKDIQDKQCLKFFIDSFSKK